MPYVKKWLLKHCAACDKQSRKVKEADTSELRYGHMLSVFM